MQVRYTGESSSSGKIYLTSSALSTKRKMEVNIASAIDSSSVAKWLQTTGEFVECVLLLDCRPFIAYNEGRIMTSCNVHCPPILKRRSGGFVALENIVPNTEKRQMLENGRFTKIIVYDTDTVDLAQAAKDSNLYSVLKSLRQQVEHCDPYYIQGGYKEFRNHYSHLCEGQGSPVATQLCIDKCADPKLAFVPGEPVEILPYLYLGNSQHASQLELLQRLGITALMNVSTSCTNHFIDKFLYMTIAVEDNDRADLTSYFQQSNSFIDAVKEREGKILVHCHAGISRSATICLAYLMFTAKQGLERAFEYVQSRRSVVSPNLNFMRQLKAYEKELGVSCPSSSDTTTSSGASFKSSSSDGSFTSSSCDKDSVETVSQSEFDFSQCNDPNVSADYTYQGNFDLSFPVTYSSPSTPLLSPS